MVQEKKQNKIIQPLTVVREIDGDTKSYNLSQWFLLGGRALGRGFLAGSPAGKFPQGSPQQKKRHLFFFYKKKKKSMHHDTPEAHYPPQPPGWVPPILLLCCDPPFCCTPLGGRGPPKDRSHVSAASRALEFASSSPGGSNF